MDLNKVNIFSDAMRKELIANNNKGDWINSNKWTLLQELYYHAEKLKDALNINDKEKILEYSADCGNLSMMIADVTGSLKILSNERGALGKYKQKNKDCKLNIDGISCNKNIGCMNCEYFII